MRIWKVGPPAIGRFEAVSHPFNLSPRQIRLFLTPKYRFAPFDRTFDSTSPIIRFGRFWFGLCRWSFIFFVSLFRITLALRTSFPNRPRLYPGRNYRSDSHIIGRDPRFSPSPRYIPTVSFIVNRRLSANPKAANIAVLHFPAPYRAKHMQLSLHVSIQTPKIFIWFVRFLPEFFPFQNPRHGQYARRAPESAIRPFRRIFSQFPISTIARLSKVL